MTDEDKALKARREAHIEALKEMRDVMLESEDWEHMKRLIDAVTAGAFAIARLNKIDFGKAESEEDEECPIKFEIVVNGNCAVCGKPLTGNRFMICEECEGK